MKVLEVKNIWKFTRKDRIEQTEKVNKDGGRTILKISSPLFESFEYTREEERRGEIKKRGQEEDP